MQAVCGIAHKDGKVLICKRPEGVPYPGYWEFPTELLRFDETLEDALERGFFDRLGMVPEREIGIFAENSAEFPEIRIFGYLAPINNLMVFLNGYSERKWVSVNELTKFRLMSPCVTFVNIVKKNIKSL